MQVGYIFQCAFELESWTDIAVVLVPSITLKIQLLELKSSTVRKLNKHLIYLIKKVFFSWTFYSKDFQVKFAYCPKMTFKRVQFYLSSYECLFQFFKT